MACSTLSLSTGSACSTEKVKMSRVLLNLGLDEKINEGHIRFGFGRMTTAQEIDFATELIIKSVKKLRVEGGFQCTLGRF